MHNVAISKKWRWFLLISVGICAASGLVYELALLTLATSLNGGGVVETSLIVAGYVASLGFGAFCIQPLLRWPAQTFLAVETLLGLTGGISALALYIFFATVGQSVSALVVATALSGILVGAEVPLLMTLLQHGRTATAQVAGQQVATLNAADYFGALIGGLAWPFLLLPTLGLVRGTLAAGLLNIGAALFIAVVLLRPLLSVRAFWIQTTSLIIAALVLIVLVLRSEGIVTTARQALYSDPVVFAQQSDYQDIVITQYGSDRRLFLNGGLQYSSRDEHRYTESLVHPAVPEKAKKALIIGGGDGLAARDLLRYPDMRITQVELDPAVIEIARNQLREDNLGALDDPRVNVIIDDAFTWLRAGHHESYDTVIIDLPDPDSATLARLYSTEFYGMALRTLTPHGRLVVQASSAYSTPEVFWRIDATLRNAGCKHTVPYHTHVPTFGDWGFILCAEKATLRSDAPDLRYLNQEVLDAATVFGKDNQRLTLEPSTLEHPRIVDDLRKGYR
ncbi:polyamine aminopropyltransferase [Corynebacterium freiburgense]|uniref:polyamine aminopropyltransferase n=1 Tax=Corynebacterium freiburgense TaxID=556548 RepID=UPI0004195018|nr:polyamine aminopropyltransferase [Corynebacterium freiburgense]WJZ02291.1 Spermidine synthase [Corynebacterium freiburgense]